MARLASDDLVLEVNYVEFDDCGWLQYQVKFLWKDTPLVNDALIKRHGSYGRARDNHAFSVNEDQGDSLIPLVEKVLQTNEPDYWEPIEPDIIIEFHPNRFFPISESLYGALRSEGCASVETERLEDKASAGGRHPDDPITIVACVDAYQFEGAPVYAGEGLALIMSPTRAAVETFLAQLKSEYEALPRRKA